MALEPFNSLYGLSGQKERHRQWRILVPLASEIALACAVVLLFFVYLQMQVLTATLLVIPAIFIGSVFCWKSFHAAQAVLFLSILVVQFVFLSWSASALVAYSAAFAAIDAALLYFFTRM